MKIVILSRRGSFYSTRRIRDAAKVQGHEVRVLDPLRCVLILEHGRQRVLYGGREVRGVDVVIPRIGTFGTDYGIAVVQQFELMGVPVVNHHLAIARAKDKLGCLQLLASKGLPVPPTILTRYPRKLNDALRHLGGTPVVLKLLRGAQGTGVVLAESATSVESVLDAIWSLGEDILIQKFIRESKGRDTRILTIGGEVVGAMRRTAREGEFRSNIHRGGTGTMIEPSPTLARLAIEATKVLGLDVAGVDLLESDEGPLLVEVNASPGFQGLEEATSLDIATRIVDFAVKLAAERGRAGVSACGPAARGDPLSGREV